MKQIKCSFYNKINEILLNLDQIKEQMTNYTKGEKYFNPLPKMFDLSNRIRFLDKKNMKIDINMMSYINFVKKTNDSVEKQQKSSLDRPLLNLNSYQSQQQFRTSRKFYPTKQSTKKQDSNIKETKKSNQLIFSTDRQKTKGKKQYIHTQFIEKSLNTETYYNHLNNSKPILFEKDITKRQIKGKAYISRKINNFIDQNKYIMKVNKLNVKQREQKQQQKRGQQLKLVQLKRKLLEQEERSIQQFQNCVLYKQKLVEKLRLQEKFQQQGAQKISKMKVRQFSNI